MNKEQEVKPLLQLKNQLEWQETIRKRIKMGPSQIKEPRSNATTVANQTTHLIVAGSNTQSRDRKDPELVKLIERTCNTKVNLNENLMRPILVLQGRNTLHYV